MPTEFKLYNVEKKDLYSNKTKNEREKLLLEMVLYAMDHGYKPTARKYNTYPSTIRRWTNKYKIGGKDALKMKNSKSN